MHSILPFRYLKQVFECKNPFQISFNFLKEGYGFQLFSHSSIPSTLIPAIFSSILKCHFLQSNCNLCSPFSVLLNEGIQISYRILEICGNILSRTFLQIKSCFQSFVYSSFQNNFFSVKFYTHIASPQYNHPSTDCILRKLFRKTFCHRLSQHFNPQASSKIIE